jgi:hypothetical protein
VWRLLRHSGYKWLDVYLICSDFLILLGDYFQRFLLKAAGYLALPVNTIIKEPKFELLHIQSVTLAQLGPECRCLCLFLSFKIDQHTFGHLFENSKALRLICYKKSMYSL